MKETYVVEILIRGLTLARDKDDAAQKVLQNCFETVPLSNILDHKVNMYVQEATPEIAEVVGLKFPILRL